MGLGSFLLILYKYQVILNQSLYIICKMSRLPLGVCLKGMVHVMQYMKEYRIEDEHGNGILETDKYIVVNSSGYYCVDRAADWPSTDIRRKEGRLDYLFCYINKGQMSLILDGQEHIVENGFFIIPPHLPHAYNNLKTHGEFAQFWVHFTGYGVEAYLKECGLSDRYVYSTGSMEEIPTLIENMTHEIGFRALGFEQISAAQLMYVLSLSSRYIRQKEQNLDQEIDTRMQKALEYIQLHYQIELSVSELAETVQLSISRFSNLFKQTFGCLPLQYIIRYRVKRACTLFRHTSWNITQVAAAVGFRDPLYFSRVFKKETGMSPSQYRKSVNSEVVLLEWD